MVEEIRERHERVLVFRVHEKPACMSVCHVVRGSAHTSSTNASQRTPPNDTACGAAQCAPVGVHALQRLIAPGLVVQEICEGHERVLVFQVHEKPACVSVRV